MLGDGAQRKSYLYAGDCVDAILAALTGASGRVNIFNLGTDEYCTVKDSIGWICARLGVRPEIRFGGGDRGWVGDNPFIFLDTRRIRALGVAATAYHPGGHRAHGRVSRARELGHGAPPVNAAIIGCGLIGAKRSSALAGICRVAVCADPAPGRAGKLAAQTGAAAETDWRRAIEYPGLALAIVATPHDALAPVALAAAERGIHVLVEKPAARCAAELAPVAEAAARICALVRVGFNHRFHPAPMKARELVDTGALGELMFLRARYGHGGRPGYDREWRARPEISGGGELIDQGVHLIDLSRWFLGEFTSVHGFAHTYFWDMPVDDNAFYAEDRR